MHNDEWKAQFKGLVFIASAIISFSYDNTVPTKAIAEICERSIATTKLD